MATKKTRRAGKKKSAKKKATRKKAGKKKVARKKPTVERKAAVKKPRAKKKAAVKKPARKTSGKKKVSKATRERLVPALVIKRVKRPGSTWPTEKEWRQSGLCSEAQADGIPCTALGRNCEICERADQKDSHGA